MGDIVTDVKKSQLKLYIDNGWELVIEKNEPLPTDYDNYTKKQLNDIAKVRGMTFEGDESKEVMVEALINLDEKIEAIRKPTNEGFTDGLILED